MVRRPDVQLAAAGRRLLRALWTMRVLGLFMIGPALGILLVGVTFGLPPGMLSLAAAMFAFSLALLALLVRGEYNRLSRPPPG